MSAEERAAELFKQQYNCAESVLLAVCEVTNAGVSDVPRIATAFGGGVGRMGGLCGALAGAVIAIGIAHGRDTAQESRDPAYDRAQHLFQEFQKIMGATTCHELIGLDISTAEGYQRFHVSGKREQVCFPAVALAARLAVEVSQPKAS